MKKMKNQIASIAVSLGTIALLAGCGTAPDEGSQGEQKVEPAPALDEADLDALREARAEQERLDEEAGLTFTLPVEDSHIVRFTLAEGGDALLVGERMLQGQTPVLAGLEAHSLGEIVDMLSPGTQLPQRFADFLAARPLEEAAPGEDGADDVAPQAPAPDFALPADVSIEKHVTSSGTDHRDVHRNCPTKMGNGGFTKNGHTTACELNQSDVDRTATASHSGAVIASYSGSTVLSLFQNGAFAASGTILQGELAWFWAKSPNYRNCNIFGCGSVQVHHHPHRWVTAGGMHHYGVVWVSNGGTGNLFPIFGS